MKKVASLSEGSASSIRTTSVMGTERNIHENVMSIINKNDTNCILPGRPRDSTQASQAMA